jgi:hypothetical protein
MKNFKMTFMRTTDGRYLFFIEQFKNPASLNGQGIITIDLLTGDRRGTTSKPTPPHRQ